ncbi:MAG TPA: VWA domain-containing protein [Phycisphaerales bacterium]|nr:VWA domain-containing protein [Phycisphaerales bacterium]
MKLGAEQWLEWLWVLPALAVVMVFAIRRSAALARRFVEAGFVPLLRNGGGVARRVVKGCLILGAAGLMVVALARPMWNARPKEQKLRGRDVCFVVDVSRSMLAEDLPPNRLERVKLWVKDAAGILHGDRVALVAFAGESVVKCPLTNDYAFFRQSVEDLSPESVSRGGTLIGDAVRVALDEVFEKDTSHKDMILITDGEDQESFPEEAGKSAGEQGVRIIAIGVGDEGAGKPIPITDDRGRRTFVTFEGKQVLSRLDGETLRKVALASKDGRYLNVGTGTIEMDRVYRQFIQESDQREMEAVQSVTYDEQFQLFLGGALALLVLECFVGDGRRRG